MKTVELSDQTHAALLQLAAERTLTIDGLLAALVNQARGFLNGDALVLFLGSPHFHALTDPAERYLALLGWCATNHASDFADFISHQESGHRYLMLTPDEVQEVRAHNHARQIDGTQFWAVMIIDPSSQRRFVRRLLEFIGCHDQTVAEACRVLGLGPDSKPTRLPGVA